VPGAEFKNAPDVGKLPVFSHAAVAGDTIYVSGTLGTVADTFDLAPGGTGPETTQTLRNIEKVLRSVGAGLGDIVKVNVFITDMAAFAEMNRAYADVFGDHAPPRITVGVAELALGGSVEIDCVAYVP
jgi:2-iminobutanoate/2-iminopropanoate deaminase